MKIKDIFSKEINRPIEGVIKADDADGLLTEVEEYVITKEVAARLEAFLDAYNNYTGANGVWISGFFGSGKSHLLKMLAILLENREINGQSAYDLFSPKCKDNEILRADLKRAVSIPSKSILFNIDQKADVIAKTQLDALLAVFVKVFDEMCGYYGKHGHIAQFERDLDSRSLYEPFKLAYQSVAKIPWEKGREQSLLENKNIAKAFAQVTDSSESESLGIIDKYRSDYRLSIEDFANQVSNYIDEQGKDFRLNFFVDEVGQYIANNVKLMTNLQTVAESLATKCKGRAWIIVTAQEDMTSIIGDLTKDEEVDFSKIQARFNNRMKLTSQDVSEVIQKRLLSKTDDGVELLDTVYHAQVNNFKTLFDFTDGSQHFRNFRDKEHFIRSYPFIPYQFDLFQLSIQNLSRHNAFEGKHRSVGERSMLGVFQHVAKEISNSRLGELATFDLMYEGIRAALKTQIHHSVLTAERNLDDDIAIRLLKALFLVKFIKEFKASVRNLCILLYGRFGIEMSDFVNKIEQSLNLLEQQSYVQRNGGVYEFLTDEEKVVEDEIKNTEVETTEIIAELDKIVFDQIIRFKKIRYSESGYDYPFARKVDDKIHGREQELSINVISPFHEHSSQTDILRMHNMGRDELIIVMPQNDLILRDVMMYKKTEKFIRQNSSITELESKRRILQDKGDLNRERHSNIRVQVEELLCKSKLFAAGNEIDISSENAETRIINGFHQLITRSYPNLKMLRGHVYTENEIIRFLSPTNDGLIAGDASSISEAEQELLSFIQLNSRNNIRTTIKSVVDRFEKKPYGWYLAAIQCIIAKLLSRGKVEARIDSNLLELKELERILKNTQVFQNVILEPQLEFTASQIRNLKSFYIDFFDDIPQSSEPRPLAKEVENGIQSLLQELLKYTNSVEKYPFVTELNATIEQLKQCIGKQYTWYFMDFSKQQEKLLDTKESVLDPIRKFMNGPQKSIYDDTLAFLRQQEPNFTYLYDNEVFQVEDSADTKINPQSIIQLISGPECFRGGTIQEVKKQVDRLKLQVTERIQSHRNDALIQIQSLQSRLTSMDEFHLLSSDNQKELLKSFLNVSETITQQSLIAVISDTVRRFEEQDYNRMLSKMTHWLEISNPSNINTSNGSGMSTESEGLNVEPKNRIKYISLTQVGVEYQKAWIANESELDMYLNSLRNKLLNELKSGNRIKI